ncbi:MAG: phosphoribosylanthranilate isomerase [Salibacteraceae bacterium]
MKVKICGLREPENIAALARLQPDFMGFIFYPPSPRYVAASALEAPLGQLPQSIRRVGVVVNQAIEELLAIGHQLRLDFFQLHGTESPEVCQHLRDSGFGTIKAFAMRPGFNWATVAPYEGKVDYFLFDTATKNFGGSGRQFDWHLLQGYTGATPFFLSGGLGPESLENIQQLNHPALVGLDANSRLEIRPGLKDVQKSKELINAFKT